MRKFSTTKSKASSQKQSTHPNNKGTTPQKSIAYKIHKAPKKADTTNKYLIIK